MLPGIYKQFIKSPYERVKEWRERNTKKIQSHRYVYVSMRNKTLKKEPCFCGNNRSEAHHIDYNHPKKIIWLCKEHHKEADKIRRIGRK